MCLRLKTRKCNWAVGCPFYVIWWYTKIFTRFLTSSFIHSICMKALSGREIKSLKWLYQLSGCFLDTIFSFPLLVYKLGTLKKAVISLSGFSFLCVNSSSHATYIFVLHCFLKNTYLTVCWQVIWVSWLFAPGAFHSVPIHVWVVGGNYCMSGRFFRWKSAKQQKYHWLAKNQTDLMGAWRHR